MIQRITEDDIEDVQSSDPNSPVSNDHNITVPALHDGSMQGTTHHERRLLDFLNATPSVQWLKKINLSSPLTDFWLPRIGVHRHLHVHFIRRINWSSVLTLSKKWLKHPQNIALLIWLLCVGASGGMLILLMLGLLNDAFPSKSWRNRWIEIDNQILNALFTLMSIYEHPNFIHHTFLLCRWQPEDAAKLRKVYCKNGVFRPNDRAHISFVVALLHITCISQYADCSLYWFYTSESRSDFADYSFSILGFVAPVFAGVYTLYSPLGTGSDTLSDEETKETDMVQCELIETRTLVDNPAWAGELFDCNEDPTACYLSFLCTFCVFGWNMERLGFGNMYVHTVTFLLLCVAPFWVFNMTALSIHDYVLGDVIGAAGIVLCFFGLLYGGFWRIQMRKTFGLPKSRWFCGSATLTDYVQWLFCWPCALAQEVRTGNLYAAQNGNFYEKPVDGDDVESGLRSVATTELPISKEIEEGNDNGTDAKLSLDAEMIPPSQPLIQFDEREGTDAEILINGSSQFES